jgi:hypothetical protein
VTQRETDAAMTALLRAAAAAPRDPFGRFTVSRQGTTVHVVNHRVEPRAWRLALGEGVIQPVVSEGPSLHVFRDAMMPVFVLHRAVLRGVGATSHS